ncbi:hypothetical protein PRK78_001896 [Emydomyces testavorans]|uniref:Uncharacterized protein n=1 Tax=Emydomyces testavorans TaxID=2070801 RepID=A0AAF0DFC9_9EURO|nr:hypothetical protein PRK78_001896 [Emydomyces testavorans]
MNSMITDADFIFRGVQWAASRGYNIVPTEFLQRYVKSVDVRRAVTKNLAFKASFGATLMLAAFSEF